MHRLWFSRHLSRVRVRALADSLRLSRLVRLRLLRQVVPLRLLRLVVPLRLLRPHLRLLRLRPVLDLPTTLARHSAEQQHRPSNLRLC
jgi:hypothetical protein